MRAIWPVYEVLGVGKSRPSEKENRGGRIMKREREARNGGGIVDQASGHGAVGACR